MISKVWIAKLAQEHLEFERGAGKKAVEEFLESVLELLFPGYGSQNTYSEDEIEVRFEKLAEELLHLVSFSNQILADTRKVTDAFFERLAYVHSELTADKAAILAGDPAAVSETEVVQSYPGFFAIAAYRIAHLLDQLGVKQVPRMITEYAHSKTGIDIHPKAIIGRSFFIDHGTGVVIGETTTIGNNVKIYQGVTLGALSVSKDLASKKRHPSIEDNVVIYAGATILGGATVIGTNSVIGGNSWITASIPSNSKVFHTPTTIIKERKNGAAN